MARQEIFTGTVGNDKTGDKLRIAFGKINENFIEVYNTDSIIFDKANAAYTLAQNGGGGVAFNNSAAYVVLTDSPFASDFGEEIYFQKPNGADPSVVYDLIDTDVAIARANTQGLYNPLAEPDYSSSNNGPAGTEWNNEGWTDLTDVKRRTYTTWNDAINGWPTGFLNREMVMHDTINDKYYAVKFTSWQFGSNNGGAGGGGFSYVRKLINVENFFKKLGSDANTYYDTIDTGVALARGSNKALYNPLAGQTSYNNNLDDNFPSRTRWNADGWDDLTNLTSRQWLSFVAAAGKYAFEYILNKEFVMHDTHNDKYYAIKFTDWGENNGGSFSYHRRLLDLNKLDYGIKFPDGTLQRTAQPYSLGNFRFRDSNLSVVSGDDMWLIDNMQNGITVLSNNSSQMAWVENIDIPNRQWNEQYNRVRVEYDGTYIGNYVHNNNQWTWYQWQFDRNGIFHTPGRVRITPSGIALSPSDAYPPILDNYLGNKIILWEASQYGSYYNYAIGVEPNNTWFGVDDSGQNAEGFKWYRGNTQIMKLTRGGDLLAANDVFVNGTSLVTYMAENNILVENIGDEVTIAWDTANAAFNKANNFLVTLPSTSKGQLGDLSGMFAANDTYLYYCTTTYVDGVADIWKRVNWSLDTW